MGEIKQRIEEKLTAAFAPARLEIIDESERHRGHGGYREGGETHFKIIIAAEAFRPMNRLERQRAVYDVLQKEMAERVHALSLDIKLP